MPIRTTSALPPLIPACDEERAEELIKEIEKNVPEGQRAACRSRILILATEYRRRKDRKAASSITTKKATGLVKRALKSTAVLLRTLPDLHRHIHAIGATRSWAETIESGPPTEAEDEADRKRIDASIPVLEELLSMLERREEQMDQQHVTGGRMNALRRRGLSPEEELGEECCTFLEDYGVEISGTATGALCMMLQNIHELATGEADRDMHNVAEEVARQWKDYKKSRKAAD